MENFKEHPISSIIGLILFLTAIVLLFMYLLVDLKREIHLWQIAVCLYSGIMFALSEDKGVDILKTFFTLGINKIVGKK